MVGRFRDRLRLALFCAIMVMLLPLPALAQPAGAGSSGGRLHAAAAAATSVYRFNTTEKVVVLTFDTDTIRGYSDSILNTLASKNVRASFGVSGVFALNNPDVVQRMVRDGHNLMNHSWDHPYFTQISSAERASQLRRTESQVRSVAGVELQPYFRPPFGDFNSSVLADLGANGYTLNVMWSVDPQGWRGKSGAEITRLVLDGVQPGAIVLMHTTTAGDDAALPGVIDQLKARGYRFATVSDFVGGAPPPPPPPPPEERYFPETGHWLSHGFLRYWERFGGLAVFGYPITDEYVDGETDLVTQYFERARFEWQPGAWPARYDVLLGLLGREVTIGREGEPPFQPVSARTDANCTFYPQTGHRLCSGFRDYWERNGGLAIFGYPISEEFQENGFTVQYFERQRFEYHPENPPQWSVLGGLLGQQVWNQKPQP